MTQINWKKQYSGDGSRILVGPVNDRGFYLRLQSDRYNGGWQLRLIDHGVNASCSTLATARSPQGVSTWQQAKVWAEGRPELTPTVINPWKLKARDLHRDCTREELHRLLRIAEHG